MAVYTLMCRIAKSGTRSSSFLHATRGCFTSHSTTIVTKTLQTPPFQARSYNSASIFEEQNQKKYYIFDGKGGIGKTTSAASLAVKFADRGHPTLLVSSDNTHPLSDCFDQDLTNAAHIGGLKSPLYAQEFNPEKLKEVLRGAARKNTRGLGKIVDEFGESTCAESLYSPDPGFDEAYLISDVMRCAELPENGMYTRVVFDTSSKGDDVLNHFLSDSEIMDQITAFSSCIETDNVRKTIERIIRARELIRASTEYVIVTTPTVTGVLESSRLHASIKKKVLVRRLIDDQFSSLKREDEIQALEMIKNDLELGNLGIIEAPVVDEDIGGIWALKLIGDYVWK